MKKPRWRITSGARVGQEAENGGCLETGP